jgi:hypothetical protein
VAHVTDVAEAVEEFAPDAVVLSGTLRDFDYYRPKSSRAFSRFIHRTTTPCWESVAAIN